MEPKGTAACVWMALLLAISADAWAQTSDGLENGFDAIQQVEQGLALDADPGPPLEAAFDRHFRRVSTHALDRLSDADLGAFFSASDTLVFYTSEHEYLDRVEAAFQELQSRGRETPFDVQTLFKDYVKFREFEPARRLALLYPDVELEELPRTVEAATEFEGPTVLELVGNDEVSRVAAGVPKEGPYVVVAGHPLCHFSDNAVRAIREDPEVAALFKGRTLWLMPQDRYINLETVRDWNREFPDYAMRWAYQTSDWPMIKRWATPNFYFYRDGTLVETVIGWPEEGQRDALLAAFAKIGVVPEAADQRSR